MLPIPGLAAAFMENVGSCTGCLLVGLNQPGIPTSTNDALVAFSLVLVARYLMESIDVGELELLKYGYKGA